eukprot:362941-Chlamydomonas_euryale.AAC.3
MGKASGQPLRLTMILTQQAQQDWHRQPHDSRRGSDVVSTIPVHQNGARAKLRYPLLDSQASVEALKHGVAVLGSTFSPRAVSWRQAADAAGACLPEVPAFPSACLPEVLAFPSSCLPEVPAFPRCLPSRDACLP